MESLKGADSRMAGCLLAIARRFGLCPSTVKKSITGIPDKDAWLYSLIPAEKRALHRDDEDIIDLNDGLYREDPEK